ncbi:MAG: Ldh family oxidoreductase [Alphaproteobacteria bacterium]|nr:Ldh family oxidoreductase [Alphaproteobacteria bacterium]
MQETISVAALHKLVEAALSRNGFSAANASAIAAVIVAAERDGTRSHGLFRLAGYISEAGCGWVDGSAEPSLHDAAPGVLVVDAGNGYCQLAFERGRDRLVAKARANGSAAMAIRNSHHLAALWHEVEELAECGLVAFAFRNARPNMLPWGGQRKIFGTNPMAFACPVPGAPPLVWDFAASAMSRGEIMLAAQHGEALPEGVGVDAEGRATTDPKAILEGGAQLPFGGYKGSLLALTIEIMASAATGSLLSIEDRSAGVKGAQTANGGEMILAIDPAASGGESFGERMAMLVGALRGNGTARVPGERRYAARKAAEANGIPVDGATLDRVRAWARGEQP